MRSNEERIKQLNKRVIELKRQRDLIVMTVCGAASSVLCLVLGAVITLIGEPTTGYAEVEYAGAALANGSIAGGYVLVALIAFMLGILLTVFIKKYQDYISSRNKEGSDG